MKKAIDMVGSRLYRGRVGEGKNRHVGCVNAIAEKKYMLMGETYGRVIKKVAVALCTKGRGKSYLWERRDLMQS